MMSKLNISMKNHIWDTIKSVPISSYCDGSVGRVRLNVDALEWWERGSWEDIILGDFRPGVLLGLISGHIIISTYNDLTWMLAIDWLTKTHFTWTIDGREVCSLRAKPALPHRFYLADTNIYYITFSKSWGNPQCCRPWKERWNQGSL